MFLFDCIPNCNCKVEACFLLLNLVLPEVLPFFISKKNMLSKQYTSIKYLTSEVQVRLYYD